jgi:MoxR-like ATPase
MDIGELKHCVDDLKRFGSKEATYCIENLSLQQAERLAEDTSWMDQICFPIKALKDLLDSSFVRREELIEISLASFIAHLPMIALGVPGTAKSNVFRVLSYGLGLQEQALSSKRLQEEMERMAREEDKEPGFLNEKSRGYFEYLVTRFTTPEELIGPAHLSLMIDHAVFYRQTTGLLPEAHVAFLDEIFKANSAILNALLSIVNERIFYNAGLPVRVPLCMVFGASNEPPQERELSALYDRFPVRVPCLPIDDTFENSQMLLQKALKQSCDHIFSDNGAGKKRHVSMEQVATVNHFRLLHRLIHVKSEYGGHQLESRKDPFFKQYHQTFKSLRREFEISDRSYFKLYMLARALAVLRGHDTVQSSELDVFKYCFRDLDAAAALADAVQERIRRYASHQGY